MNASETTFEEAKKCPKCGKSGKEVRVTSGQNDRGKPVKNHLIECVTQLCPWFGTPWVVTEYEDGSIPQPYTKLGDKQFLRISQESMTRIEESVRHQLQTETKPDGEIQNPHG